MKYLIYIVLLTLITPTVLATDEPFYLADDQDFPPYAYRNDDGKKAGIVYDLLSTAFTMMDQDIKYELYPWKRAQKIVSAGIADALVTVPTKERLSFLVASEPIIIINFTAHYNNDNPKQDQILAVKTIEELKKFQLIDFHGDGWAEANLKNHNVLWTHNYNTVIKMLALNKEYIFLDDKLSIQTYIKKQINDVPKLEKNLLKIKHGQNILFTVPISLLIRKDSNHSGLIKKFNETLQTLKESGEYQKIINKYIL